MKKQIEEVLTTVQPGTSSLEELAAAYDQLHKKSENISNDVKALDPNITYKLVFWPEIQTLMDHKDFSKYAILCQEECVPSSTYFVPESMILDMQEEEQPVVEIDLNLQGLEEYFLHLCEVDEFTNEQVTLIRNYPKLWESSVYEYQRRKDRELNADIKHLLSIPEVK